MPSNFPAPTKISNARLKAAQRDKQIERMVGKWKRVSPILDEARYTPQLRGLSMVTLMMECVYNELRKRGSLINPVTGEAYHSVDLVRRLAETQKNLASELGLTPRSAALVAKPVDDILQEASERVTRLIPEQE